MREDGHTLVEALVVTGIVAVMAAVALPQLRAYSAEAHLLGSARVFKGEFLKARSIAARSNGYTALRFERGSDGTWLSTYLDGNHNGVRAADIASGIDARIAGPVRLDSWAEGVRVAVNPGIPAIPPEKGVIPVADAIRFTNDTVSFSPLGTATPGTFYLAGEYGMQGAVRVVAGTARVRLLVFRGGAWVER